MSRVALLRPRILVISAVATVLAAATGCGGSSTQPTSSGATKAAGSGGAIKTIQFVNPLPNYPAWRLYGDCLKKQAQKRGVQLTESGPTGSSLDAAVMLQQVQSAIAAKKDAIITLPASDAFGPVLEQAQKAGIVTATLYGPGGANSGATINVGVDWTKLGEQMVGAIAKLPGQHNLGLVAAADTGLGKAWLDGMKSAAEKTKNVKVTGEVYTGDDASKALPQVNALLSAHPDINQIASHMGTTTPGAAAAIKAKHLQGKVFFMAQGHDNGGTEAAQDGTANLILLQNICGAANAAIDAVMAAHGGTTTTETQIPVDFVVVTKAEMKSYLDKGWS
jgi:ABC-type sugar transport system substrate-binding protein